MKQKKIEIKSNFRWGYALFIVLVLMILSSILASFVSIFSAGDRSSKAGNVALIKIDGVILSSKEDFSFEHVVSSSDVIELIEEADSNPSIKAIILEINSPGGSAVASSEIADAIKKTNKTTVAWIRDIGTSGAYWVASAADYIVANKASITGSIGVIGSYLEFPGFLEKYNVTYRRLVSGEYKDIGSPFKQMTEEEQRIFQKNLDAIRDFFIEEVAKNRNMKKSDISKIATGVFYTGADAKSLGIVDELGSKDEVIQYIEKKHGIKADIAEYKKELSLFELLAEAAGKQFFRVGEGIGSVFVRGSKLNSIMV